MFGHHQNQNYIDGGLNSCWLPDNDTGEAKADNTGWDTRRKFLFLNNRFEADDPDSGLFRISVRLEDIFGFATDYRKVMYGFVHTLTLIRNLNHKDALFGTAAAADGKIVFSKISWILPIIEPSEIANFELVKQIKDQKTLSLDFRVRQCTTTVVPASNIFLW